MTQERRTAEAMQVGHVLNMVAELPRWAADPELPLAVRAACLESHAMNVRAACEFFARDGESRDIRRQDWLQSWTECGGRAALSEAYDYASKQVAHLSRKRAGASGSGVVMAEVDRLWTLTGVVLDAAREFAGALRAEGSDAASPFAGFTEEARRRATTARPALRTAGETP